MPEEKPKKEKRVTGLHERGFKSDEERQTALEHLLASKNKELALKEKELSFLREALRNGRGMFTPQKIVQLENQIGELTHACVGLSLSIIRLQNEEVLKKELKRTYTSSLEHKAREEANEMKLLLRLHLAEIRKQEGWAARGTKPPLGQKRWSEEELLNAKIRAARIVGVWKKVKKNEFKLRAKPNKYAHLLKPSPAKRPKPPH